MSALRPVAVYGGAKPFSSGTRPPGEWLVGSAQASVGSGRLARGAVADDRDSLLGEHAADDLADPERGDVGGDVDLRPGTVEVEHGLGGLHGGPHPRVVVPEHRPHALVGRWVVGGEVAADAPVQSA